MAHPTPRADALRQMREAKFEAEQKRLKQETSKPAEAPKRKPETTATAGEDKPAKPKPPPKVAKAPDVAEIATAVGAEISDAAPAAKASAKKTAPKTAAPKTAPKKAVAKKAKASAK